MEESHFWTMMRMVQPHVSGQPKRSVELMLQSADLVQSIQQYREPALSACDTGQDFIDFEAMLTDLQTVCNPAEAEFINLILNFFRSRKIYSAYRAAAVSQQSFQQSQAMQENLQETKETTNEAISMEMPHPSQMESLLQAEPDTSAVLSAAEEKTEAANFSDPASGSSQKRSSVPLNKRNAKNGQTPANTFRNLMGNQALQSLLSPTQKENLNQIESLMQVLS